MDEVRSWLEVPAIAHFFNVFKESFDLIEFEIEDFEEALFLDSAENVSSFLPDLVIRLLRGLYKTKDGLQVTIENYNNYLQDLLYYRYVTLKGKENPIAVINFKSINTRAKIEIIYDMCNWRLEMEDAMELTKNLEAEEMRTEPVGIDAGGHVYWYFYGTRLYKETALDRNILADYDNEEEQLPEKTKSKKRKKKKKKKKTEKQPAKTTKYGRAVKKRKLDYSSQEDKESEEDSEDSDECQTKSGEEEKITADGNAKVDTTAVNSWCVACSTLQQWEELTQSFKTSKNKNDSALYKSLVEFTNIMPDIFIEKERALQRKLLAMAPRRASDRIQLKVQQRETEERLHEQERILKSQQKAKETEERQKELLKEKEKEREKRYLEREKNLELRALRAKQREEMKLVADNPELAKEIQIANKEKAYKSTSFEMESDEDDKYFAMERVLNILKDHDDAWPFLEPVDEIEAPNYYTFIENPIDFSKMSEKIKKKIYKDKQEFQNDMRLLVDNCETYNGTYSPFTKFAFKIKKVFDKMMKREFPPEVDFSDDLYEEDQKKDVKPIKIKKKTENATKTPREKKTPKSQQEKRTSLQSLQAYNSIITPEFAHAQIMQAKLLQGLHKQKHQHQTVASQTGNSPPQILPKLGIPQDILAKMSPAQLQMFMLQYRAGAFSGFNKGQTPLMFPAQKLNVSQNPSSTSTNLLSQSLYKLAGSAASLSPLHVGNKAPLAGTVSTFPAGTSSVMSTGGQAPKKLQLSQLLSMQRNLPKHGVTVLGKSPLIPGAVPNIPILSSTSTKLSPATLEKIAALGLKLSPTMSGTSSSVAKTACVPTTTIPVGTSWEAIKNSLKVQNKDSEKATLPAVISKIINTSSTTGIPNQKAEGVRLVPVVAGISSAQLLTNQMKLKQNLLAGNIAIRSSTPTTFIKTQLSSISTPGVNNIVPPSPGRLIIRRRDGQASILSPKGLLTNDSRATAVVLSSPGVKKVGLPLMNSNVRFIGQSDGQIKKIIMIPSSSSVGASSTSIPKHTVVSKKSNLASSIALNMFPGAIASNPCGKSQPPGSVVAQPLRMKVPLSIQQSIAPIYLASQGVPLQLINQSGETTRSLVQSGSSVVLPKLVLPSASSVSTTIRLFPHHANSTILVSSGPSKQATIETAQNLHVLKKDIQQIAAVNQISSKLQSHFQDVNKTSSNSSTGKVVIANASQHISTPAIRLGGSGSILSINAIPQKMIIPTSLSVGRLQLNGARNNVTSIPRTSDTSIVAMVPSPTLAVSSIQHSPKLEGNVAQIASSVASATVTTTVNSFILTGNSLVDINTIIQPQTQQEVMSATTLKQQNITPNVPTLNNKQTISTSLFTNQIFRNQPSSGTVLPISIGTGATSSVVTPEKLRDAEALLGLIDPKRLVSNQTVNNSIPQFDTIVKNNIKNSSLGNSLANGRNILGSSEVSTAATSTLPAHPTIMTNKLSLPLVSRIPNSLSMPSQASVSALKLGNNFSSHAITSKSPANIVNSVKLKSPVKIQLPGSPSSIGFRTIPSSILVASSVSKSPINVVSPKQTTKQLPNAIKESPVVQAKDISTSSLNTSTRIGNGHPENPSTTHKMVVNQAQIQKLQAEGRLLVAPSGQMYLLAQPGVGKVATDVSSNSN